MRTTSLLLAASSFVAACDLGPSVSGTVAGVRPDGSRYEYKYNCRLAVTYSMPRVKTNVSVQSVGSGDLTIDNTTLQQTDHIFRALDFAQFSACQDAMKGGDTQLYGLVKTALDQYTVELARAKSASEVQSANQRANTALENVTGRGASTPEPAEPPERKPEADNADVIADTNADNEPSQERQTVVVRVTPRTGD